MKEKIILVAALCIMGSLAITGCGDDAIREGAEDLQETQEDVAGSDEIQDTGEEADIDTDNPTENGNQAVSQEYRAGDVIELVTDNGGRFELTITDWGTSYEEYAQETQLYVEYDITNTGTTTLQLGNVMFDVYADNYAVGQTIFGKDNVTVEEVSAGRSLRGRLYAEMDPSQAEVIELEIGDVVIVLKDGTVQGDGDDGVQDYGDGDYDYNNYLDVVGTVMLDYGEYCEYALYDMDHDGMEELIVGYGTSNADWSNSVWTTDGHGVIYVGDFYLPVIYCEASNGIGIDAVYMHGDYMSVERITKVGNSLNIESVFEGGAESGNDTYEAGNAIQTYYVSDDSMLR